MRTTRASRSGRRSGTADARSRRERPRPAGMDHVGITVPDIEDAVAWFEDVMGCGQAPLGWPVLRSDRHVHADLARGASACGHRADHDMRCGDGPERRALFQYTDQTEACKNSDFGGVSPSTCGASTRRHALRSRRGEAAGPAGGDGRPWYQAVDQLLPRAARHLHRAGSATPRAWPTRRRSRRRSGIRATTSTSPPLYADVASLRFPTMNKVEKTTVRRGELTPEQYRSS